jgi:hypothetical protein
MYLYRELVEFTFASLILFFTTLHFLRLLKNRTTISFIDISILITGITFGLAPFISVFYGSSFPDEKPLNVAYSYIGIMLFLSGLVIVKKIFTNKIKNNFTLNSLLLSVNKINSKQVFIFYSAYFIIRLIFATKYGIFGSGSATSERMTALPYFLFVTRSLLDLTLFGVLVWCITKILINKKIIVFPAIIIIIETLLIFFRGRRQMLFILFLFLYLYIILGYRINFKIFIPSLVILILMVNIIFPIFISLRDASLRTSQTGDVLNDYKASYYVLSRTGIDKQYYESNVAQRVYINNWNIDILKKSSLSDGLNGQALAMCIIWAIPRPLLPIKGSLKDPELLINVSYGLPLTDSSSNWPAYGFADFGVIGGLLYGLLLGLLLLSFQYFAKFNLKKFPFLTFIIIGSVTFTAFFI